MTGKTTFRPTVPVLLTEDETKILLYQFEDKVRQPHRDFHRANNTPRCPSCDAQDGLYHTLQMAAADHLTIRLGRA